MYIDTKIKKKLIAKFRKSEMDTGSPEVQIALLTYRIKHITARMKFHKKDFNTRKALLTLVVKRRKMLNYLLKKNISSYRSLIKELEIIK